MNILIFTYKNGKRRYYIDGKRVTNIHLELAVNARKRLGREVHSLYTTSLPLSMDHAYNLGEMLC